MKIISNPSLAPAWIKAAESQISKYDNVGWLSVTSLIAPIRVTLLRRRHDSELEENICDRLWMLLGTAVHTILESADDGSAIQEQRFCITVSGREISMKPDYVTAIPGTDPQEYHLRDFKVPTYFALLNETKVEYVAQLSIYAYGFRTIKVNVTRGTLEMLIRDWNQSDYEKDPKRYPDECIQALDVALWTDEQTKAYLERRVAEYEAAWNLPDSELPVCTPEERWQRPSKWALQKPGAKKAFRVYDTHAEAERNMQAGYDIVHRPGEDVRCERTHKGRPRFCSCRRFCSYWLAKTGQSVSVSEDPF